MRFGLQKLTLLDFPGMTACTVFTSGCNFRCPFCHNPRLVFGGKDSLDLDLSGILDFLKGLLPRSMDTADLMIIFLLLLMNKDDEGGLSPVLTLALYFLL